VPGRRGCKGVETGSPREHARVRESAARASLVREREGVGSSRWAASGAARARARREGWRAPQGLIGGVGWSTGYKYPHD
jgi:hypothetical protein